MKPVVVIRAKLKMQPDFGEPAPSDAQSSHSYQAFELRTEERKTMITERALNIKDLIVDKPEEGLFAYHRSTMTSPEILELEKQKIFQKCWLYLGHESEVPKSGDFVRRTLLVSPSSSCGAGKPERSTSFI